MRLEAEQREVARDRALGDASMCRHTAHAPVSGGGGLAVQHLAQQSRDLFVAMGNPLGENAWSMRIQYKPLVRYIWLGALVMAIGGLVAATDRRYRVKVPVGSQAAASAPPDPRVELGKA